MRRLDPEPRAAALFQSKSKPVAASRTRVSISGRQWRINGRATYPGTRAEGLLMNVRMVNAVFEDRNRPDFDAETNTAEFITKIPDYVAHGIARSR